MSFKRNTTAALVMLALSGGAFAAQTGGFATTDGGNKTGSLVRTASTMQGIINAIAEAKAASKPLVVTYTGNEDALINQVIKDHTVDASGNCPKPRWNDAYREVQIKDNHLGITIQGANGSSANFGITMIKSSNIIIKNMKMGALAGANNDADVLRIDNSSNIWIDHNELFAVNNECKGSPDGDLTFESLLDIKKDAKNITVSYNIIRDSKKVGLMGHTQSGGSTDFYRTVTFHHNIYRNVNGRLPLQRGGLMHAYNNLYSGITGSGINVRANGVAVIERNWFENSKNPLTCRFDTNGCGKWHLIANNVSNSASNATYKITWDSPGSGGINAENWTSTQSAKPSLPYQYEPVSAQCVKDRLHQYAGVGKNGAQLTAAACSGSTSSSSASSSSSSSSSAASSSSSAASSSSAGNSGAPVLSGTGDYPTGFSKCADLNGSCAVPSGSGWVAFGRKGSWVLRQVGAGNSIACTVAAFGSDPGGNPNKCSYQTSGSSGSSASSSSAAPAGSINLGANNSGSSIVLNWTPVNLTPATQEVYRDTDSNPSGRVRIASVASSVRSYTDNTAAAGVTYYYWIKTTSNGVVTNSNAAEAIVPLQLVGTGDYPNGFSKCSDAGQTCSVSKGTGWVAFGRKGSWVAKYVGVGKSISCSVSAFGSDPGGNPNKCSFQN